MPPNCDLPLNIVAHSRAFDQFSLPFPARICILETAQVCALGANGTPAGAGASKIEKKSKENANMQVTQRFAQLLIKNVGKVIVGKQDAVELMMIALLCRGHVLIEDVPGVGKTTLASALARSLDCSFKRIQFTPDITPSDITGFSIVNFKTGELEYRPGLVMSQIVLADEINRTSPKTQSSLLEVMEEGQVTVDGTTYRMPSPFIVLATQNPVDFVGTYPLPEAQLDRFFMRVAIGYPTPEEETDILERYTSGARPMEELKPICSSRTLSNCNSRWIRFIHRAKCAPIFPPLPRPRAGTGRCSWASPRARPYRFCAPRRPAR